MRTKSGRWLWVMDRGKIAERDKDGSPLRVTGIIADITERKKAEEALRESEMRFRNILGTVPDMISIHSPEMDILYSNWQGFGAVPYNMRKTDTKCYKTYRGCNDVCPDCLARDVLKTKQPMREEAQLPDGSWVDLRVIPLIDENDKVEMFMEWVRDITDQKKAEEEIKMLAHSLKNINECVSITDLEDKLIFVNDSFLDTYGYNRDELIGKHISLVDSPKNTPQLNAEIMSATFSGGWSGDIWNRRKDGSEFPINLSTKIIYDKDNKPFSLIGVAQDITERKQAEEALAMQNALLKTQQELSLDGILVVDADDKIISFNQHFADIWNIPDNIMALQSGDKALNYVLPMLSDQEDFVRRIHEIYKNKQAKSFEEIPLKDGRVLERYSAPIIEDQQYYHGRVWFYRDITERKKAEEEQENLRQQLAHSQKIDAVGRLAAGVAHDYNNTLSVVLGYAELILLKLNENHPVFNSIKEIQKAAERSSNLTRQLMTFARREPVNTRVINLNEAIENMMGMLRKLIRSNISLNWQPGKELWSIIIDPVQIDQILVNLCVNASDAIDGLGSVTIETRNVTAEERITRFGEKLKPGDYVLLKVSDDGCGMDEKTLGKIFEPFFTSKSEGQGTGLGLATVHGAVRQNNGLIDVESELGVGTTLYIFLPRSEQKVLPETEDKETHEYSLKDKVTVLVVDDDETIPEMLKPMIEILGHEVLTACKPTDAIELFKQNSDSISLLISDVMMPEMNGVELANRLLEIKPDLKILFSSGYSSDIMTEYKMAAGMVNFITKPFKMKSLHAKIAEVLDN
jgi:PAS domain S-box-containing protein